MTESRVPGRHWDLKAAQHQAALTGGLRSHHHSCTRASASPPGIRCYSSLPPGARTEPATQSGPPGLAPSTLQGFTEPGMEVVA